ncbi:MAG: hypothetical protein ACI9TY_001647 [Alphaproteobacteria bacterium]|jgi:hypothetical protein
MIFSIFKRRADGNTTKVFESALSQARNAFPNRFNVDSNTLEARRHKFESISIFMVLYAWYLKGEGSKTAKNLSQDAYDYMFDNFEIALREQGVSDVRIGPEVKKLAAAFHGRLVSYGEAFDEGSTAKLTESFLRNSVCDKAKAMSLAITLISEARKMQAQNLSGWLKNLENLQRNGSEPKEFVADKMEDAS